VPLLGEFRTDEQAQRVRRNTVTDQFCAGTALERDG
jgi:hypothetical protein